MPTPPLLPSMSKIDPHQFIEVRSSWTTTHESFSKPGCSLQSALDERQQLPLRRAARVAARSCRGSPPACLPNPCVRARRWLARYVGCPSGPRGDSLSCVCWSMLSSWSCDEALRVPVVHMGRIHSCPRKQLPTQTLAHANTCPPVPLMQTGLPDSDTMSAKQPPALGCHDLHV